MIIRFTQQATQSEIEKLTDWFTTGGYDNLYLKKSNLLVVPKFFDEGLIAKSTCIEKIIRVETPFQLSSKEAKPQTFFSVNGTSVGDGFNMIAGPCSVETEEQIFSTAEFLHNAGIKFIRGGAFKPRKSPYSFRGLGERGLKLISEAAKQYKLSVVTELMDLRLLDKVMQHADVIQVGSRNMDNYFLLNELGKTDKPVLLKRGMNARVYEWLLAADYVLSGGNEKVILCERGIRSFDPVMRNVMDVAAIPLVKSLSHLPVFADPSHGTGSAQFVTDLSLASAVAGADGLVIEIHPEPAKALSDSLQALNFDEFIQLQTKLTGFLSLMNKQADFSRKPDLAFAN